MKDSFVFGITGYKFSGKSSLSKIIKCNSIPVIDVDTMYTSILSPGTEVYREILFNLGDFILDNKGNIDLIQITNLISKEVWIKELLDEIIDNELDSFLEKMRTHFVNYGINIFGIESRVVIYSKLLKHVDDVVIVESTEQNRYNRLISIYNEDVVDQLLENEKNVLLDYQDAIKIENNEAISSLEEKTQNLIVTLLDKASKVI